MALTARRIDHIDPTNLIMGGGRRGNYIPLTYENNMLVLQTPYMEVKGSMEGTSFPNIFEMSTWFRGDSIAKQTKWFQLIECIEKKAIAHVVKNFDAWFATGTKQINWRPIIKNVDKGESSYFVRWPVEIKQGAIVNDVGRQLDSKSVHPGNLVKLIVECPNIWISGNKCGLMMVVRKILVRNQRLGGDQYDFGYDSDEDHAPIQDQGHIISMLAQPTEKMPVQRMPQQRSVTFQPAVQYQQRGGDVEVSIGQQRQIPESDSDLFQGMLDDMDSSSDDNEAYDAIYPDDTSGQSANAARGKILGEPSMFTEMDDQ
jgi:hypothetical protein